MLPARDAYELWAETYPPVAHNPLMRLEQEVVGPLLAHIRAARALDVGSGSGRYVPQLQDTGTAAVFAVDFSLAMLSRGRTGPGRGRICADARQLPFRRATFDLINASLMVGDIVELDAWCREMARVLTTGGHLVYSDFHPSWAERGWSRTFRSNAGVLHDVSFNPHTIDDHLASLEQAGFRVRTIREPRFSSSRSADPEIKAFRRRWGNPPVVVAFHAVREP
jgi:malonyl-CoA O-methyltransferase